MSTGALVVGFDVNAPVEEAHAFVIRDFFLNHERWDPGIAEVVALDDGPVRPRQARSRGAPAARTPLFRLAYPLARVAIARQVRQNMGRLQCILNRA